MPKFLYLTESLPPPYFGGSFIYLRQILAGFAPGEVAVITSSQGYDPSEESPYNPSVIRRRYLNWANPKVFKPVVRFLLVLLWISECLIYIRRNKIKMVAAGEMHLAGVCAFTLHKLLGLPYLVHTYGGEIENLLRAGQNEWLHIPVLQNANALITVSQFTARRLNDLLPAPPPIHLVRCGVNIDEFVPNIDTQSLRRQLGLQSDEKIMLQVGRMDLHKGHERALRIFPDLLKKIPELKYIIAGSGPQEGRLKMLAKELGVEERVIFCGRVPQKELPRYYNLADVCVAPSETIPSVGQTEGFGLVLLEAAACGKPSVAGAAGGMPEAIVDGETGFLIQSGDDQALRDAIAKLLEDPALARKMGAAGRQWAQQWTWERSRQALKTILARYGEKDIRAATG